MNHRGDIFTVMIGLALMMLSGCDSVDQHHAAMHTPVGVAADGPGVALIQQFCSACHAVPAATAHSAEEWPAVLARMLGNMRRSDRPTPSPVEVDALLDYLQANAR